MRQIVVEPALGEQLSKAGGQTVVCDSSGRALGFFSPLPDGTRLDDLQLEPPLSIAEVEELRKDRSGKPLSVILERLGLP